MGDWVQSRNINGEYGYLNMKTGEFRTSIPTQSTVQRTVSKTQGGQTNRQVKHRAAVKKIKSVTRNRAMGNIEMFYSPYSHSNIPAFTPRISANIAAHEGLHSATIRNIQGLSFPRLTENNKYYIGMNKHMHQIIGAPAAKKMSDAMSRKIHKNRQQLGPNPGPDDLSHMYWEGNPEEYLAEFQSFKRQYGLTGKFSELDPQNETKFLQQASYRFDMPEQDIADVMEGIDKFYGALGWYAK